MFSVPAPRPLSVVDAQGLRVCESLANSLPWSCVVKPGTLTVSERDFATAVTRELEVTVRDGERRGVDLTAAR